MLERILSLRLPRLRLKENGTLIWYWDTGPTFLDNRLKALRERSNILSEVNQASGKLRKAVDLNKAIRTARLPDGLTKKDVASIKEGFRYILEAANSFNDIEDTRKFQKHQCTFMRQARDFSVWLKDKLEESAKQPHTFPTIYGDSEKHKRIRFQPAYAHVRTMGRPPQKYKNGN